MNSTILLAWRNVFRQKTRSVVTGLLIAISASVLVFFMSLQLSSYQSAINASVLLLTGHLQLQHPEYFKKAQIRKSFRPNPELIAQARKHPEVISVAPRAAAFAVLSTGQRSAGVQVLGVVPERELEISSVPGTIVEGLYLAVLGDGPAESAADRAMAEVVIGRSLARRLLVSPGSELTLLGQARDGSLAAAVLRVRGIFESGSEALDAGSVQLTLPEFDSLFALDGEVHQLLFRLRPTASVAEVQADLVSEIPTELTLFRWDQILPGLREAITLDMAGGWVFYLSLIVVVAFSVLNTFLMAVLERTREFAVMLALGATPGRIAWMICIEALLLCAISIGCGVVFGGAWVFYFNQVGFVIPGTEAVLKAWNLPPQVYPRLSLVSTLVGPMVILGASLLACVGPAIKAMRLNPSTALGTRR